MARLVFILAVSFGSLLIGWLAQVVLLLALAPANSQGLRAAPLVGPPPAAASFEQRIKSASTWLKLVAIFALQPIPILNSFWKLSPASSGLLAFPFLGALSLLVGGAAAVLFIRLLKIPPAQAGSVFTLGMFTNLGSFGTLLGWVMFGDRGFMLVQLFTMSEMFLYFAVGFPLSSQIGRGALQSLRFDFSELRKKPAAFVPLAAIAAGTLLRLAGAPRPALLDPASALLIPLSIGLLGFAIGLTLRVGRIRNYRREVALVMAIKFAVIPLVMLPLGFLLGLHRVMDGVPIRVLAICSFMPSAFTALVPPALYGFDLDMANSGWFVTTVAMLAVIPILFLVLT